MENRVHELALFNLGIDSRLRGCDLVSLKVRDICHGDLVASRAVVMQHKTQRPVQFEHTRDPRCGSEVEQAGRAESRELRTSESHSRLTPPGDPAVRLNP